MRARDKFKLGDRVRTSAKWEGLAHSSQSSLTGTVTGFGQESHLLRIRRDGKTKHGNTHSPETWHMDYWVTVEGE